MLFISILECRKNEKKRRRSCSHQGHGYRNSWRNTESSTRRRVSDQPRRKGTADWQSSTWQPGERACRSDKQHVPSVITANSPTRSPLAAAWRQPRRLVTEQWWGHPPVQSPRPPFERSEVAPGHPSSPATDWPTGGKTLFSTRTAGSR